MKITVVGYTSFAARAASDLTGGVWEPQPPPGGGVDADAASFLSEFAGRGCYESWSRPNPATATIGGYLRNIFDAGHWSVLEHGSVSLHLEDVSRALTHELIRHRHLSFSQLSQRFVDLDEEVGFVVPPLLIRDIDAIALLWRAWGDAVSTYRRLLPIAQRTAETAGYTGHMARKRANEAVRCVLPNMTPTKLVVTGNHRAWIDFLLKRGDAAADLEINDAAIGIFDALRGLEPPIYDNLIVEPVVINGVTMPEQRIRLRQPWVE